MTQGQKPWPAALIDLYRMLYNAKQDLTFDQLVDGMPSAYQNDANRHEVEARRREGRDIPGEPWSSGQLLAAKRDWVEGLVKFAIHEKRVLVNRSDGSGRSPRGRKRDELLYSANKNLPPSVSAWVLEEKTVKWTPEIGATGRRHMTGVRFRDEMRRLERQGFEKPDKDNKQAFKASKVELTELLRVALEALSSGPAE